MKLLAAIVVGLCLLIMACDVEARRIEKPKRPRYGPDRPKLRHGRGLLRSVPRSPDDVEEPTAGAAQQLEAAMRKKKEPLAETKQQEIVHRKAPVTATKQQERNNRIIRKAAPVAETKQQERIRRVSVKRDTVAETKQQKGYRRAVQSGKNFD